MGSLKSLLVERGIASMRQVEEAMAKQVLYGGDLASHLLELLGASQEASINQALADHHGLVAAAPGPLRASSQALSRVPQDLAIRHQFYPLSLGDHVLSVAVSAPLPEAIEADLFTALNVSFRMLLSTRIRVRQALARDCGLTLDMREQRQLARVEGRPDPFPSIPPPPPDPALRPPPSLRAMALPQAPTAAPEVRPVAAWPPATRGLLRWMQIASQSQNAPRRSRRRGPMSPGACEEALGQATQGEEALQIFFDFAQQYFSYSALFVVHNDLAEGRDAYGPGADREKVCGIGIPLDLPSCLAHARNRGAPVCVALQRDGLDANLAADLGRSPKGTIVVVPVLVRQRCIALLYGDDSEGPVELAHAAEAIAAASRTGAVLERLALERKRKRPAEPTNDGQVVVQRKPTLTGVAAPAVGGIAPPVAQQKQFKSQLLARALGLPAEAAGPVIPPPTLASPGPIIDSPDNNPFRRITATFRAVSPPTVASPLASHEPSSDENLSLALAPTVLADDLPDNPAPSFSPSVHFQDVDDEIAQAILQSDQLLAATYPPSDRRSYSPPFRPPSEHQPAALPSVIVEVGGEHKGLVERLVASSEDDDDLLGEVLREGVRLVPALLAHVPGPLRVDLTTLLRGQVKPSQAGPLLRAIAALRRTALPFVVVQSGNANLESRLYATLLLGEFPYPEAVQGLLPRFFDGDPNVADAALASARLLLGVEGLGASLLAELNRIASGPREPPARREVAARALASLSAKR